MHIVESGAKRIDALHTFVTNECNLAHIIAESAKINRRQLCTDRAEARIEIGATLFEFSYFGAELINALASTNTHTFSARCGSTSNSTCAMPCAMPPCC